MRCIFFFFLLFLIVLLHVAMAMHFTAVTLTFPHNLSEKRLRRGQRVLKCHILAGDYSTKGSKAFAVDENSESSVNSYQHRPPYSASNTLLLQHITCQLWALEWDKPFVHVKGERCLLTRPPQPPHFAQWVDGVVTTHWKQSMSMHTSFHWALMTKTSHSSWEEAFPVKKNNREPRIIKKTLIKAF